MEISCQKCTKKFEVNDSLIPKEGRLVQCGSCDNKWFFKKPFKKDQKIIIKKEESKKPETKIHTEKKIHRDKITPKIEKKEIIYKESKKRKINYFKLLIVLIITLVAIIVFLDTFKNQISSIYPNINLILDNLYESLKDINLFLRDLIN